MGLGGATTSAAGNSIYIDATGAIGVTTITATAPITANGLSGSPQNGVVTLAINNATTSTVGIASFNATNFSVSGGGAVTSNAITVTSGSNITATSSWNLGGATSIAVSGTTNHAVQVGNGTGSLTSLTVGLTGTVLAGVTGADPSFQTLSAIAVTSITATAPLTANATSGVAQTGSVTLALTTPLDLTYGGTNASLTASNGGIFYSTATAGAILSGTATASKMLLSGSSAAPTWSTSTIPSSAGATANKVLLSDGTNYVLSTPTFPNASATSGKIIISDGTNWIASTPTFPNSATGTGTILRADGTNWVATTATYPATTTINQILYSSSANTIGGITASANGVLISSATNVPSWLAAGTTGQYLAATTGSPPSWATLSSAAVTSIAGTSNQIAASASVGSVILSFTNGISIGSYQAISPPTGGIILPGKAGFGTSSIDTNASYQFNSTGNYNLEISGTQTTTNSGFQIGIFLTETHSPTSGAAGIIGSVYSQPFAISPAAQTIASFACYYSSPTLSSNIGTITNCYGFFAGAGSASAGTVTNHYGGYFTVPSGGTNKHALHADNMSIGTYTGASAPPSNSLIVSGQIGSGTTTFNSSTNLIQAGTSTTAASNYIAVDAANGVDKGFQWYSAGVSRVFAIVPGGAQTTWQLTTGTQIIGADLTNARVMIGTGTAVNKLDVNGGMAVGSYAGTNTAASNSVIISGSLATGTSTNSNQLDVFRSGTGVTCIARIHGGDGASTSNIGQLLLENTAGGGGNIQGTISSRYFGTPGNYGMEIVPRVDASGILGVTSGQVIFGSSTANVNSGTQFQVVSTKAYGMYSSGTQVDVDGSSNSAAIYVNPTLQPTNGSTISAGIYDVPLLITPSGKTITVAAGQYINCDTGSNVGVIGSLIPLYIGLGNLTVNGTIQNAYGIYVSQPLASATGNYYASSVQGGQVWHRTGTNTDYQVTTADCIVGVTSTAAARNVTLPSSNTDASFVLIVKDESGGAAANNITIVRNGHTIDGAAANIVINTNYGVARLYSDGTNYFTW